MARGVGLAFSCATAASTASAQVGGTAARPQPLDTLWVIPRLEPTVRGAPPSGHPAAPSDSPTIAIPGTNGRAALGVEPPPVASPGDRVIIAPGTITTPPRSTRGQSGTVPALSITIPTR